MAWADHTLRVGCQKASLQGAQLYTVRPAGTYLPHPPWVPLPPPFTFSPHPHGWLALRSSRASSCAKLCRCACGRVVPPSPSVSVGSRLPFVVFWRARRSVGAESADCRKDNLVGGGFKEGRKELLKMEDTQQQQAGEEGVVRIGKRCFVGNLAWRTSWQDLKASKRSRSSGIGCRQHRFTSIAALDSGAEPCWQQSQLGCRGHAWGLHAPTMWTRCPPQDKFRECGNVVYTNVMRDDDGEGGRAGCLQPLPRGLPACPTSLMGSAHLDPGPQRPLARDLWGDAIFLFADTFFSILRRPLQGLGHRRVRHPPGGERPHAVW